MTSTRTPERAELGRFFTVLARQVAAGKAAPEMFSPAIDAEWHRLLEAPEYAALCLEHVGRLVDHVEGQGYGPISWVSAYEDMFGPLPEIWFTHADGTVDRAAMARYQTTGEVWAAWNCSPKPSDPDAAPEKRDRCR